MAVSMYKSLDRQCNKACSTGTAMDRATFFKRVCRRQLAVERATHEHVPPHCLTVKNYLKAGAEGPYETSTTMSQCTGPRNRGDKDRMHALAVRHPKFPFK